MRTLLLTLTTCLLVLPAQAKYSGGSGTAADPYQIATAADLIALGATPADYDKHFLLTADIDLDPNLPGRKVFDKAVIAPDMNPNDAYSLFQGTWFTGVFDGSGHTISHLTIQGRGSLGLFGALAPGAEVRRLGVMDVDVIGSNDGVSVGVGGLAGGNGGTVTQCYSTGIVSGPAGLGGLVGANWEGGVVTNCYSTAAVSGSGAVGGLVGSNGGTVTNCCSTGAVSGPGQDSWDIGGLVGSSYQGSVTGCSWDIETSGQAKSAAGTGKTTTEMRQLQTFQAWGTCGNDGIWTIDEGRDYPRLWWENKPGKLIALASSLRDLLTGEGTERSPYLIRTAEELNLLGLFPCEWDKHFKLMADIDLSAFDGKDGRAAFNIIGDCHWVWPELRRLPIGAPSLAGHAFTGVFDGNRHTVSHVTIRSERDCAGLFSGLEGVVKNLGVVDVNVTGSGIVGGLVGYNAGTVTNCHTTGAVRGDSWVGGLAGISSGYGSAMTRCYSTASVSGSGDGVGGLAGVGTVLQCYSTGAVSATGRCVGGLVGSGWPTDCYSISAVNGASYVGGLAGEGKATRCYNTGAVSGTGKYVGGVIGIGSAIACFWDTETSGQATSDGGTGKTTAQMQTARTFLDAGWDFVGETANGTADIWWILEGKDYPRLWWELPGKK